MKDVTGFLAALALALIFVAGALVSIHGIFSHRRRTYRPASVQREKEGGSDA